MGRYAERTKVPVDRTRSEIEKVLKSNGSTGFIYGSSPGRVMIGFEMKSRRLRFVVPMPEANKTRSNEREVDREVARRWRSLLLLIKAKLESVGSGIVEFDQEFLAHIVIQGSETVGDRWIEAVKSLDTGTLPPLLGPG